MAFDADEEPRYTKRDLVKVGCLSSLATVIVGFLLLWWMAAGVAASSPGQ